MIVTHLDLDIAEPGASLETESRDILEHAELPKSESLRHDIQLLDQPPDEQIARKALASCPTLHLLVEPQHRFVRQEEQSQVEYELRKSRCIWIVARWGAGEEGFLAATLERLRADVPHSDVYQLRSDDAADLDAFEALFPQQFGMSLQSFCGYAASIRGAFLLIDGVHPGLCTGEGIVRLQRITSAILDYCPELRLILTSRLRPGDDSFSVAEIRALEVPDVRTYISHHRDVTPELQEPDVIEKLYEYSDGLPKHLDRMLTELKVSSLSSVLEAHLESSLPYNDLADSTPRAMIDTVSVLCRAQDKRSKRSLRLLKVLSLLPYGETLDSLRHYLPTEPFFADNALQLSDLALLDVVPLQHSATQRGIERVGTVDQGAPKILKVPRQVRDYVQTLLEEDERLEIIFAGTERFFGRAWRRGKLKLRALPIEYRDYLSSGAGNEFALIHHLVAHATSRGDGNLLRRVAKLSVAYVQHLNSAERFRDVVLVAGPLVQQIERELSPEEWGRLSAVLGIGLRMTGKHVESIQCSKNALEVKNCLTATEQSLAWLNIALAEQSLGNAESSIEAANEVKKIAKPESGHFIHALSIIASLTLSEAPKLQELKRLEKQARDRGYSLADTLALELANETPTASGKIALLDRVLDGKSHRYNRARAAVAKAEAVQQEASAAALSTRDLTSLAGAYSYLHGQRFANLFDRCHEALWDASESTGEVSRLLRLFRHASFVWRIRGDDAKEAEYLNRLSARSVPNADSGTPMAFLEIRYYWKRLKLVLVPSVG